MKRSMILVLGAFLTLTGIPARAWHAAGHSVTASIAYQELQDDPDLRKRVVQLLLRNADFKKRTASGVLASGLDSAEYQFMRASTWADEIRGVKELHVRDAHFINQPFTPPNTGKGKMPFRKINILTALAAHRETVKSSANDNDRGIALAWLFHLVGDIHQPFHSIALVNGTFKTGDLGGNAFKIVPIKRKEDQVELHGFWDGFWDPHWGSVAFDPVEKRHFRKPFQANKRFPAVHDLAADLVMRHPRSSFLELQGDQTDKGWADESYEVAKAVGYFDQGLLLPPGKFKPTTLSEAYQKVALQNAERRVTLAGYRLADTLRALGTSLQ